jgi:hypothetical protein
VAAVSGLEVALFSYAHRAGLLLRPLTPSVYRWGVQESLSLVLGPRKPPEADELLRVRGRSARHRV